MTWQRLARRIIAALILPPVALALALAAMV